MNAPHLGLPAWLALAAGHAMAHPPGLQETHPQPPVPQPVAPASVPNRARGDVIHLPYVIDDHRDLDIRRGAWTEGCIAPRTTDRMPADGAGAQIIDWCALPPYEPRYAPQIPAEWWWRHTPWTWRPW